jgi:hypothetical protein
MKKLLLAINIFLCSISWIKANDGCLIPQSEWRLIGFYTLFDNADTIRCILNNENGKELVLYVTNQYNAKSKFRIPEIKKIYYDYKNLDKKISVQKQLLQEKDALEIDIIKSLENQKEFVKPINENKLAYLLKVLKNREYTVPYFEINDNKSNSIYKFQR